MKIAITYVFPAMLGDKYLEYAVRFLQSYHAFPPGIEHDSVVVINGSTSTSETLCLFSALPNLTLLEHDNSGYDIGAFQHAARVTPCDLMVFFGSSSWFNGKCWLQRMAQAFSRYGNALYGTMGNRGNPMFGVAPHLRTTAFWLPPRLMNEYPMRVTQPGQRFPFEHGPNCLTTWVTAQGLRSWEVTWTREYLWQNWGDDPNGYQKGNQSGLIAGDRLCLPPYFHTHG
jgi:hypothetical protein